MIIGIAGLKHSGKNTAAKFLAERYEKSFKVREWSFAHDLKVGAARALGVDKNEIEFCDWLKENGTIAIHADDDEKFVNKVTGREYLQLYGTESHREVFGEDFWVDNTLNKIKNPDDGSAWEERLDLITDVRFPNEAIGIKEAGGYILRIDRKEVEVGDGHASEKPLPDDLVDRVVDNNASLDHLEWNVFTAAQMYLQLIVANRVRYA